MPLEPRQWDLPHKACFEDMADCLQPPPFKSLLWSHDKESFGKRFSLSDIRSWCASAAATRPHGGALESSQKGLMILDQSGNQTRLLQCQFPLRFPSHAAAEPVKLSELQHGLEGNGVEEFDKNYHVNGKESEMHEDTEEIDALLYSDDDDDDDEDCESGDEEVMSTGHSPYSVEQVCNKRQLEEICSPCKRQRLVENISGSSSLVGTSSKEDTVSGLSNEQSRKDKIRTALKILESIVPGAKGNQALLLLDEAIDYLKLLKQDVTSH